jgi:SAM-dependent methyltransferase
MALGGAERVVAADIGGESLDYLRRVIERYKLTNIEIVEKDITDLSAWPDESFDFVASNGVLHHTKRPEHGLLEHFRITRRSGVFWLYLYGAGGLYWHVYDRLRPLVSAFSAKEIRSWLTTFGLREGLIYTFLDNLCAPRTYHDTDDVLDLLRARGRLSWRHARGKSVVDDTAQLLASKYGPLIYGPKGEVRIIISREA